MNEDEFETFKKFDVLHALGAHQAENIKVEEPSLETLKTSHVHLSPKDQKNQTQK